MTASDRHQWLFPVARGTFGSRVSDTLDPANEDDRAVLINAEHPELIDAIEQGRDDLVIGGVAVNPRLHLNMHEVVARQVWTGDPPEVWRTAERLSRDGYDRHETLHMLASVLAEETWAVHHDAAPSDRDRYVAALDALPGAWEADRPPAADGNMADLDDTDDDEMDLLFAAVMRLLGTQGPLTSDELQRSLGADPDEIEMVTTDPMVVLLGDDRLASVPALLAGTLLTHRLSDQEAATETLRLGVDVAPAMVFLCGAHHLHLAGGEVATVAGDGSEAEMADGGWLEGPDGWLGGAAAGDLVGYRLADVAPGVGEVGDAPSMEIVHDPGTAGVPDTLAHHLEASFARFGHGARAPLRPIELVCQLAVDAPALTAGVMAPLNEVLERAGFEVHDGYTAPVGADWEMFDRLRHTASCGVRHGLGVGESHALVLACELCRLFREGMPGELGRDMAREVAGLLDDADVAEAFAETTAEEPGSTMDFVARVRGLAGRRSVAQLAWVESLVAGRAGALRRAEACLHEGLAADAHHEQALEDAAWYASDRGDARQASRLLERLDDDPDEDRTMLLRGYSSASVAGAEVGRNDPCPCGSGRKYKQCCLRVRRQPEERPLPDRLRWLWEKLRWWLDRAGRDADVLVAALALHGGPPDLDDVGFLVDVEVASSLVLFNDGAISDFLGQRGPLLPDDERNLVAQWALTQRSVHEVVEVETADGFSLRDLRTGEVVEVRERRGSAMLSAGDLICAHAVFDGVAHQLIGGMVPVPLPLREPLLRMFDEGADSTEVALALGRSRRARRIPAQLPR
ncbi:MAG: DUF1841 family protein [Actinomycetota bacterium]|nr:DUF1841 family protein [Actinomycetota bacterium]